MNFDAFCALSEYMQTQRHALADFTSLQVPQFPCMPFGSTYHPGLGFNPAFGLSPVQMPQAFAGPSRPVNPLISQSEDFATRRSVKQVPSFGRSSPNRHNRVPVHDWTEEDTLCWVMSVCRNYNIRLENINLHRFFLLNGQALCRWTQSDFLLREPHLGQILFQELQQLLHLNSRSATVGFETDLPGTHRTTVIKHTPGADQPGCSSYISPMHQLQNLQTPMSSLVPLLVTLPETASASLSQPLSSLETGGDAIGDGLQPLANSTRKNLLLMQVEQTGSDATLNEHLTEVNEHLAEVNAKVSPSRPSSTSTNPLLQEQNSTEIKPSTKMKGEPSEMSIAEDRSTTGTATTAEIQQEHLDKFNQLCGDLKKQYEWSGNQQFPKSFERQTTVDQQTYPIPEGLEASEEPLNKQSLKKRHKPVMKTAESSLPKRCKSSDTPMSLPATSDLPAPSNAAKCHLDSAIDAVIRDAQTSDIASTPVPLIENPNSSEFNEETTEELEAKTVGTSEKVTIFASGRKRILWKFVLDLLDNPETNPSVVKWLDCAEGVFRITDSAEVAWLWDGRKYRKKQMSYEKLSRAFRNYYALNVLLPGPKDGRFPKKLVYQFGPHAVGWEQVASKFKSNISPWNRLVHPDGTMDTTTNPPTSATTTTTTRGFEAVGTR